jgi:predicted permease
MPFVLALQYKIKADSIGMAIILSTVASLFTLSVLA